MKPASLLLIHSSRLHSDTLSFSPALHCRPSVSTQNSCAARLLSAAITSSCHNGRAAQTSLCFSGHKKRETADGSKAGLILIEEECADALIDEAKRNLRLYFGPFTAEMETSTHILYSSRSTDTRVSKYSGESRSTD